jgi:3-phenylpropionate/cinnamic acid dioxygenase small subunit
VNGTDTVAPLPYTSEAHQLAHQFLVEEAHLLDTLAFDAWLGLLTEDVRYVMPVRVTAARGTDEASVATIDHFAEDLFSLRKRVARFATDHAWTEDPPSRLRHHLSNVRTFSGPGDGELTVESPVLLFRSRGDDRTAEMLSAGRRDVLRATPDGYRLARRTVTVDESVLRTQNLAIFL